jgi:hypothetical protein
VDNDTYEKVKESGENKELAKKAYEEGKEKIREIECKYVKKFLEMTIEFSVKLSKYLGKCISEKY